MEVYMIYAFEMPLCGMITLPSFMKIDVGVQVILRFCPRNLRGCYVGITERKDLWSMPVILAHVAPYKYQVS
jgi:hypothetical protein